jgi:hypothetical protein
MFGLGRLIFTHRHLNTSTLAHLGWVGAVGRRGCAVGLVEAQRREGAVLGDGRRVARGAPRPLRRPVG